MLLSLLFVVVCPGPNQMQQVHVTVVSGTLYMHCAVPCLVLCQQSLVSLGGIRVCCLIVVGVCLCCEMSWLKCVAFHALVNPHVA